MARFTIVLPFARYDGEVRESLVALAGLGNRAEFEILCVWNNVSPLAPAAEAEIRVIMKGSAFRVLHYPDKLGPSQAWCFGLRQAMTEYVCFLAVDAPIAPGWGEAVAAGTDGTADIYQGSYSAAAHDDAYGRLERAIDRVRFEDLGIVDFRNFIVRRTVALALLDEYFRGLFFSDVELDILRARMGAFPMKRIPEARVVNIYPRTLSACARRKFRHGVNVGHILRHFPTEDVRAKLGPGGGKRRRDSGTSGSNARFIVKTIALAEGFPAKLALAAMHGVFFGAAILGLALPGGYARRFYIMHFEDQDSARKTSDG
jgi:glycosyltransferase involved in cell wall biosynthesis